MKNKSVFILGVRIDLFRIDQINDLIIKYARKPYKQSIIVFKPYVEFLSLASRNKEIQQLLNKSDFNIADSTAIQWAASYLYGKPNYKSNIFSTFYSLFFKIQSDQWRNQIVPEKMAGLDQSLPLLEMANERKLKIGVIGGPKNSYITQSALRSKFPLSKIRVWSGYYEKDQEGEIVRQISEFGPDILFCAMGFPRQEQFAIKYKRDLNSKVIIGEGGSFDYSQLGGPIRRAPKWMRNIGLEWLWRLILQPKRIRRQLAIPHFISKVRNEKLHQK